MPLLDDNGQFIDKGRSKIAGRTGDIPPGRAGATFLLYFGALIAVGAMLIAFFAKSIFVEVFFTGWMITGVVLVCTGVVLRALARR